MPRWGWGVYVGVGGYMYGVCGLDMGFERGGGCRLGWVSLCVILCMLVSFDDSTYLSTESSIVVIRKSITSITLDEITQKQSIFMFFV